MAANFDRAKRIDIKTQYLVFGYFRQTHSTQLPQSNPYFDLQQLLVYICLNYYQIPHKWDQQYIGECTEINDDYVSLQQQGNATVLLEGLISEGIHEYRFEILTISDPSRDYEEIEIGIVPKEVIAEREKDVADSYVFCYGGYVYCTSQGRKFGVGIKVEDLDGDRCHIETSHDEEDGNAYACIVKSGDVVSMNVNFDANTISYKVNENDYGVAFEIRPGEYRVGVYLYCEHTKFRIMQ